ncbi:MAG: exodeoxyribonuclease VII small subunit [Gemmiger sp.]
MKAPKSFEEGLQRLQQILAQMQDDSTSLNDSVKLYAEAAQLIEYCDKALNSAKLKIDEIDLQLEKQRSGTDGDPDEQ